MFVCLFVRSLTHSFIYSSIVREDLKSLVHLKYCIKESLRLFPPVPRNGRVLSAPTEIDGRLIPEGTTVIGLIYGVHHHPDFWENPDVR